MLLTLPTGGGRAVLTKGKEEFQKKAPAPRWAAGADESEPVGELLRQLPLGLLQAGQERRALDADDVGDGLVGEAFLAELSDTLGLRHELLQTLEELIQLRLLGKHLFNRRSAVRNVIGERSIAARQRIVKRDGRVVAEFAVEAVAVAQPPFAARAEAFAAILHAFPQRRAVSVIFAILVLGDLVPGAGDLVIDTFTLVYIVLHLRYLQFAGPEPEAERKKSVTDLSERDLTRFDGPATLVGWYSYSVVTAIGTRATSACRGERI